jgi:hemin uptake protein HemP
VTDRENIPARNVEPSSDQASPAGKPLVWKSSDILQGSEMVLIEHVGETYQLRVTRQGKLILNK